MRSAHAQARGSDAAVGVPTGRVRPASPSAACVGADCAIGVREKLGQATFSFLPARREAVKKPHNEAATQLIGSAHELVLEQVDKGSGHGHPRGVWGLGLRLMFGGGCCPGSEWQVGRQLLEKVELPGPRSLRRNPPSSLWKARGAWRRT